MIEKVTGRPSQSSEHVEISRAHTYMPISAYALMPVCTEIQTTSVSGTGQQNWVPSFLVCCGRK